MNEEQQAELLAAWLADPEAAIPDGLDPDVVETVVALHPERAPAPRVTAESILDLVETGPLAPTVVQPPTLEEPANRGWWKWALAGSSTLVAAALALVVVGVGVIGTSSTLQSEPDGAAIDEGVAAVPSRGVDTGLAEAAARRPRAKPAASPRPRPMPRPSAARQQLAKQPIAEAPAKEAAIELAEPDAVAFAEDEGDGDFVDGVDAEPAADLDADASAGPMAGGGLRSAGATAGGEAAPSMGDVGRTEDLAPRATPAAADDFEAEKASSLAEENRRAAEDSARRVAEEGAEVRAEEERRRPYGQEEASSSAAPAAAREAAEEAARRGVRSRAKEEAEEQEDLSDRDQPKKAKKQRPRASKRAPSDAMEPIPEAASAPAAPPPPPSDPDLRAARAFLAAGDPASALNAIARGLKRHPSDSRIRQQLFQVRGQAYTALGQTEAAAEAYREAQAIGARL